MRGVLLIGVLLSVLLLSSCETPQYKNPVNISEYNSIHLIDYPYEPLDPSELDSVYTLFKNENKALSLYRKTLDLFPNNHPFATIIIQQDIQIGLFEEVYAKYELTIPEENWYDKVTEFENPDQACAAAIIFAESSIVLYDEWLSSTGFKTKVDNQDLRFLYTKIRNDYEFNILPLLKRCSRRIM